MTTFLEGSMHHSIDHLGLKECGHLLQAHRVWLIRTWFIYQVLLALI